MVSIRTVTLIVFSAVHLCQAGGGTFVELSVDQAHALAKEQEKVVAILFVTPSCSPCQVMRDDTFTGDEVLSWFSEHAVTIWVDAAVSGELASAYRVSVFPTLLFVSPDGQEMGRITGLRNAQQLIAESTAILAGKNAIVRFREQAGYGGDTDPVARWRHARTLVRQGSYDDALAELLVFLDSGSDASGLSAQKLGGLYWDLIRLADKHPAARQALRDRREAARCGIVEAHSSSRLLWLRLGLRLTRLENDVEKLVVLDQLLQQPDQSLALFDELRQEDPRSAAVQQLGYALFDQLLAARRYGEITDTMDVVAEAGAAVVAIKMMRALVPEEHRSEAKAQERFLQKNIARYYQVLVGLQRHSDAAVVAARLLEIDDGARVYHLLASSGLKTGAPIDANLTQARTAHELGNQENTAIAVTWARLLHSFDRTDEACQAIEVTAGLIENRRELRKLSKCQRELGCEGAAAWARSSGPGRRR